MGAIKYLWNLLLDGMESVGEVDADKSAPLPTDDDLWNKARTTAVALGIADLLGEQDPDLLPQLREAYNTGRQPTRFDMHAVVDAVRGAGVKAFVEHTGGGTATIYAGPNRAVSAGPGVYEGYGPNVRTKPYGDTAEFRIGPNRDDADVVEPPEHTDAAAVARLIVEAVRAAG